MIDNNMPIYVHSGIFHSDDLFCIALLKLAGYDISKVRRVAKLPEGVDDSNAIIADVGGGKWDHHQADVPFRDPEDPMSKMAAFGRMWRDLAPEILGNYAKPNDPEGLFEETTSRFDRDFISLMDKTDNFGMAKFPNPLAFLISCQNDPNDNDKAFINMVDIFAPLLEKMILKEMDNARQALRAKELGTKPIVVLADDEFISAFLFKGTNAKYVVSKSLRGGYQVTSADSEKYPIALAKAGSDGCSFVHPNRFIASFDTKENAVKAAGREIGAHQS